VPTDHIIALHYFDDVEIFQAVVVDFALRFDDVLDHEKLRLALERLMQIGNWRKLGARLRRNVRLFLQICGTCLFVDADNSRQGQGKLEYHIPTSYDEKRPGFIYEQVEYAAKIGEHPIGCKIPRATSRPLVAGNVAELKPLTRSPDTPTTINDFLYSDRPQLSIKITSFEDATLVSLSWPHTFLDAMGRVALFKNWIAVLEGREQDVQPLHGYDSDPLITLGTKPTEPSALAGRQIQGFSFFIFILRYLHELLWYPREESRVVCLPGHFIQGLKQEALEDLSKEEQKGDNKPFLSDGDIICAWWSRRVMEVLRPASYRTVAIMNSFGLRAALSRDLLPADRAYLSNASLGIYAFTSVRDILTKRLGVIASKVRESIAQQGTREQIEAFTALARDSIAIKGRGAIFGDSSSIYVVMTNWSAAKFFEVDLSAAVIKEGLPREVRANALGKPSYVHGDSIFTGYSARCAFPIMGKDAAGNYWLSGTLRKGLWSEIERTLEVL